jgi:hypothetical protein
MGPREMDALIIRHLADIEEAGKRAYLLDDEILKILGKAAENWTKSDWEGKYDIEDEFSLCPLKWKRSEEDKEDWLAYFQFDVGADDDLNDDADFFKLTRLCQARNGKYGFRWRSDHYAEGRKVAWRNFIRDRAEEVVRETGFEHEKDGTFFLTVTLNAESLAKAIEQDAIEDVISPFKSALDALARTEPAFTRLLEAAEIHFKA